MSIQGAGISDYSRINYLGNGSYEVGVPGDADGDGVRDGDSLSGERAKIRNEGDVNKLLAPFGLKMVDGQPVSIDGFSLTGSSAGLQVATTFGGPPVLPDVGGPVASATDIAGLAAGASGAISDGALLWLALSTLAHTQMRDMKDAKDLKNAFQTSKIEAKDAEIKATQARIEAERKAAQEKFWTAVVVAVISVVLAGLGASASTSAAAAPAGQAAGMAQKGAMLTQAAGAVGSVGTALVDWQSKERGAQAEANQKLVEEKIHQKQQEQIEANIQEAQNNYEEAKELFKLAVRILTEHAERQTQITEAITRSA